MISTASRHRLERLIITVDESSDSERALPIAIALAERIGIPAELLSVVDSDVQSGTLRTHLLDLVRQSGPPVISSEVTQARDVAGEIGRRIRSRTGAVVVMNSRGPRRTSGVLTESLAAELLADGLPIVIVGPRAIARPNDLPVVACLDGSPESEQVIPFAAEWAMGLRVPLMLLIVARPLLDSMPLRSSADPSRFDPETILRRVDASTRVQWPDIDVHSHLLSYPWNVADALTIYLDRNPAQLFAVATHLRTDWARLVHPSTTARIVHQLAAPILVVPIETPISTVPIEIPLLRHPAPSTAGPGRSPGVFDEIILPIDGEHITSDAALTTARNLAVPGDSVVTFLACGRHTARDVEKERLRSELTEFVSPASVRWQVVQSADVVDATIAAVAAAPRGIVCLDTSANGQFVDTLIPTVTGQIIRWSPRAVVLVGPRCRPPETGRYSQIVACIDGSLISEAVAELAARWAADFGLPAFILEVVEPGTNVVGAPSIANRYVDRLSARLAKQHKIVVTGETIDHARASIAIRQWADAHTEAILVMASHGRGMSEQPLGGVVMDVVRHVPTPVVVIPAHQTDTSNASTSE